MIYLIIGKRFPSFTFTPSVILYKPDISCKPYPFTRRFTPSTYNDVRIAPMQDNLPASRSSFSRRFAVERVYPHPPEKHGASDRLQRYSQCFVMTVNHFLYRIFLRFSY